VNEVTKFVKAGQDSSQGWSIQMRGISQEEPGPLVESLTGAILGCGGWILSRGANDSGMVNLLFEFERQACIDIYSVLVAAGVELSQSSHMRFTELCRCTQFQRQRCSDEIACIDLEVQTLTADLAHAMEVAQAA
jgi:hypothetical protein